MDDIEHQITKIITNLKKNPNREYTSAHIEKLKREREQLYNKVKTILNLDRHIKLKSQIANLDCGCPQGELKVLKLDKKLNQYQLFKTFQFYLWRA